MANFRVLVVEDDQQTARMVRFYLDREGFTVIEACDGPSSIVAFQQHAPHLIILDVMLPGFDGLEVCRRIRQKSIVPILMLTARTEDTDKVIGLGIGADDYLTKPFNPLELCARVKALLRRAYQYNEPSPPPIVLGGPRLLLDPARRELTLDGQVLDVTPTEFDLLKVLMTNPGWAFTRSHLLETVWGYGGEANEEIVTAHLSNVRRKLGPSAAHLLRTVRGAGYAYEEER